MTTPLKLRAEDEEDLRVIAACLQDALIPLSDIHFQEAEQRFILVANRFRWENCPDLPEAPPRDSGDGIDCSNYERVNCGILFENVSTVRRRGLDQRDRGRILELLTMDIEANDGHMAVVMLFAGGAAIRLEGPSIKCRISDIGEPWPTQFRPSHSSDDAAA
ncbi:MAG TPA: DUF2948 family protein [Alphaproteobacteria bacterium]